MAYLGNVFISIGNAVPDGLTLISLAKLGEAKMGITGSLSTNMFSFLFGFGISCMITIFKGTESHIEFDIFSSEKIGNNKFLLAAIIICMVNQILAIINGFMNRF
jgi:Ca2+/Na+ antiporter